MPVQTTTLPAHTMTTLPRVRGGEPSIAQTICAQVGNGNILAISGGRVGVHADGIVLPVSAGYRVTVTLDPSDTYTVRRVLVRGTKVFVKGEQTNVFCDGVGDAAYVASCYVNRDFGDA